MKTRIPVLIAASLSGALALSACGGSDNGSDTDSSKGEGIYRVVVAGGESAQGVLALNSATAINAAKAVTKVINNEGGIGGCKIELTVVDDTGDAVKAVGALQAAFSKQKPDLVVNAGPTTVAAATAPAIGQSGALWMNSAPFEGSGDPSTYPNLFNTAPQPAAYMESVIAKFKAEGYKSVAIMNGNSPYGKATGETAKKMFAAAGLDVTGQEEYDSVAALDMTPQLSRLKAKNPEVLFLNGYGSPIGYVLDGKIKLGWDVPIIGDSSTGASSLIQTGPPDGIVGTPKAEKFEIQFLGAAVYQEGNDEINTMVDLVNEEGEVKSGLSNAWPWDSLRLVQAAADKVGGCDDTQAIVKALEDPEVTKSAKTALLQGYEFSTESHDPVVANDSFTFSAPKLSKGGQLGRP